MQRTPPWHFGLAAALVGGRLLAQAPPPRSAVPAPDGARPNVVFIVLDDAGFADLGCFGSEIRTPTIDRLAAGGLRYNNFHTTALCSPSRACLLTGRNHHTVGMRTISNYAGEAENNRGRISERAALLSEVLRGAGYSTLAVGKWHLAPMWETSAAGPYDNWPLGRGFERYYGFLDGSAHHFNPELVQDNQVVDPPRRPGYHLTGDLVDHAIGYLRDLQSVAPEKPFFLYFALGAPHAPHHAPQAFLDRYRGAYDQGWDRVRAQRFERMQQMGVVPASAVLAPRNPGVKPWDGLSADEQRLFARFQEAYAGFLEHTDHELGRLISFLDRNGRLDNTFLVLLSDNGASAEGGPAGTTNILRAVNGLPSTVQENLDRLEQIGGPALEGNYPAGWAQVSNTPFPWYKQTVHGGGIRDPLIVHWPAGIKDRGGIRPQFEHLVDVVPTVLELADVMAPTTYRGVPQLPMAGRSMVPTFAGPQVPGGRRAQYFEMLGHRGIYQDGWKAVTRHSKGAPFEQDPWQLFDLSTDFSEVRDLADRHPDRLRALQAAFLEEAGRHGALPLDDRTNELRWLPKKDDPKNRDRFIYHQGMQHLPAAAAPDTRDRSYTVTVEVERRDRNAEGVLLAFGGSVSGYSLYIKGNRLIHDYNGAGPIHHLPSREEVPLGRSVLQYEFRRTGPLQGVGTLRIDGREVGQSTLSGTLPTMISFEGLDVGRDAGTPVSPNYQGEFPFRGTINRVVVERANDR